MVSFIIITENGICTEENDVRIQAIKDYLQVIHMDIPEGIDVVGYIHGSTFDNVEWNLAPTYRFGLMTTDLITKDRIDTPAAHFYEKIAHSNGVDI